MSSTPQSATTTQTAAASATTTPAPPKLRTTLFGVVCEAKRSLSASKDPNKTSTLTSGKKSDPTNAGASTAAGRFSSRSFVSMLSSFPFRYALASDGFRAAAAAAAVVGNTPGSTSTLPTTQSSPPPAGNIIKPVDKTAAFSLSSTSSFVNDSSLESVNHNNNTIRSDESDFIKKESVSSIEMESV